MTYKCRYCDKDFRKESTLTAHLCEAKRRHQQQNETGVQLGYKAYLRFYETTQGSARLKTYEDFADSAYYRAFVKYGRHCVAIRAINFASFTDWLLKNNKKLDYWCKDSVYEEYLHYYLKLETMEDALARGIEHALRWAETHNAQSQDYLRYGNGNAIMYE